jgi:hypothetical protein
MSGHWLDDFPLIEGRLRPAMAACDQPANAAKSQRSGLPLRPSLQRDPAGIRETGRPRPHTAAGHSLPEVTEFDRRQPAAWRARLRPLPSPLFRRSHCASKRRCYSPEVRLDVLPANSSPFRSASATDVLRRWKRPKACSPSCRLSPIKFGNLRETMPGGRVWPRAAGLTNSGRVPLQRRPQREATAL